MPTIHKCPFCKKEGECSVRTQLHKCAYCGTEWVRNEDKVLILNQGFQDPMGPSLPQRVPRKPGNALYRIISYLKPNWLYVVEVALATVTVTILDLLRPWIIGFLIVGEVIGNRNLSFLPWVIALLAVVAAAKEVAGYLQGYFTEFLSQRVLHALRYDLYRYLESLRIRFFDNNRAGDLVSRVISDTEQVEDVVTGFSGVGANFFTVIAVFVLLFYINLNIALLVVPLAVTLAVVINLFKKTIKRSSRRIRDAVGDLAAKVDETISGIRIVKSFSMERDEARKFHDKSFGIFRSRVKLVNVNELYSSIVDLIVASAVIVVIGLGAPGVVSGTLTLGALVAILGYVDRLFAPIIQLSRANFSFQKAKAAAERIFEIIDTEPETTETKEAPDASEPPQTTKGEIEFDRVSFSYEPDKVVLDDFSLKVRAGETLAIVGRSGAGKSTVVNLLLRFYEPTSGRVLVDGRPIHEMKLNLLRQKIAVVLQDPILFTGSIRENIAYGKIDATDSEITEAARAANAHDFIMDLPDGYGTQIGERGVKLSGGQRQRIAIARALLKNPSILILDEATSNVDSESELLIQDALEPLVGGRTIIVIGHRLSTVMNADKIVVLEDGGIVEIGTHEELLVKGGIYAKLYEPQLEPARYVKPRIV